VAHANLLACRADGAAGRVFNIGCGQRLSINGLFDVLCKLIGKSTEKMHTAKRTGDVRHSMADITAARNTLEYSPRISVEKGLEQTVAFYISANQ